MSKTEKKEPANVGSPTPKKKRGRKSTRMYFTHDTELAIGEYLASNNEATRNKIFNERINYSFYKLAENLIHTFKFYFMSGQKETRLRTHLPLLMHQADHMAAQIEFEQWNSSTSSIPSIKPKNASKADKIQRKSKAVNEANNPNLSAATLGVIDSFFNED